MILLWLTFFWLVVYIFKRLKQFRVRHYLGLTGPPIQSFLDGNLRQLRDNENNPVKVLHKWRLQYGDIFGYYIGPRLVVVVCDSGAVNEILVKNFNCFASRMILPDSVGEGSLGLSNGVEWRKFRKCLNPQFSVPKLKKMAPVISTKVQYWLQSITKDLSIDTEIDIYPYAKTLTAGVMLSCFLGITDIDEANRDVLLQKLLNVFVEADCSKSWLLYISAVFPEIHTATKCLNPNRVGANVIEFLEKQLRSQRAVGETSYLFPPDCGLTDRQIVDNMFSFLVAGYETTSTTIAYCTWFLAKYPDIQDRLRDEIQTKLDSVSSPTYDHIHQMTYLDAVFKECLRLMPPVTTFVTRTCTETCMISGIKFTPGINVLIPIWDIQNDPNIWQNPEDFNPDRFLDGGSEEKLSWIPFGDGPRNCIGLKFAELEVKACLVEMVRQFVICPGPNFQDPIDLTYPAVVMQPTAVKVLLKLH